jgi:hypothetical protein
MILLVPSENLLISSASESLKCFLKYEWQQVFEISLRQKCFNIIEKHMPCTSSMAMISITIKKQVRNKLTTLE